MEFEAFRPTPWLRGRHTETIVPALWPALHPPRYRRERWTTPDGDFIDLDWVDAQLDEAPVLVLFHGLEGSSGSHYARAVMREMGRHGWRGVVPHFRGCSGELNLAPRFYHSGDSAEVDWILKAVRDRFPRAPLHAAGVSLGGNALLRWLGESERAATPLLQSAVAVSAPLDLTAGGRALSQGFNRFYTAVFLRTLKSKCDRKLSQFPGLFDRRAMRAARNLYQFDNIVTAPLHGYRDTDDYWTRASAKTVLRGIHVPTLLLNARNDPFLPDLALPGSADVSPSVTLEFPEAGGHVGFFASSLGSEWLPKRIAHFMQGVR